MKVEGDELTFESIEASIIEFRRKQILELEVNIEDLNDEGGSSTILITTLEKCGKYKKIDR